MLKALNVITGLIYLLFRIWLVGLMTIIIGAGVFGAFWAVVESF